MPDDDFEAALEAQREADASYVPEETAEPVEPQQPADAAAAVQPEPAKPADEPGRVPLATLIAERDRRRQAEARIAELERRFHQPAAPQAQPSAPQKAEPEQPTVKYEDNAAEWLRQNTEIHARRLERQEQELAAKVKAYEQDQQQYQQQAQQAAYVQQLDDAYRNQWVERLDVDPNTGQARNVELQQAHNFFTRQFIGEAMAIGRTRPQAEAMLVQAERQLAYEAFTNELDPVDLIVARAKARGFRPTAAVQPEPAVAAPAPAAAAPAAAQPEAQAQARRAAARSLGSVSGSATTVPSPTELSRMTQAEFDRWHRKNPDLWKQAMGG